MEERIQKIISNSGFCSRRKAELLIKAKRVKINGNIAILGEKAKTEKDLITIDNNSLPKERTNYKVILLNKPPGIITSCKDEHGRKTVIDLLPKEIQKGMHPIGRLDKDSRGALLISNHGNLTLKLTHPRYHHKKVYLVEVEGNPSKSTINKWENGVFVENKKSKDCIIKIINRKEKSTILKITLFEGRNRQIRKIGQILDHNVIDLKRIEIAHIKLNNLKEGSWREIPMKELKYLLE